MFSRVNGLAIGLLCWLMAAVVMTAPPPITLPDQVKGEVGDFVTLRADTPGKRAQFVPIDKGLRVFPADLLTDPKATVVSATKEGRYRVLAYTGNEDGPSLPAMTTVVIGADIPQPMPPGPAPQPNVRTNPFTDDAARVMIVVAPFDQQALTIDQATAISGEESWAAMKGFGEFRIYPKGQTSTNTVEQKALERPMAAYPWLMVGKGSVGWEGKLESTKTIKDAIAKVTPVVNSPAWTAGGVTFTPACRTVWDGKRWVTVCP